MLKMTKDRRISAIEEKISSHPDFPKKGIIFRDFLPVLRYPELFADVLSLFVEYLDKKAITVQGIVALEARGFLLGPTLAQKLNIPFIPVRKPGKLPGNVIKESFTLEYNTDSFEMQVGAVVPGMKVVVVDDLVATGGSMEAAIKLVKRCGGTVEHCLAVMELNDLNGRKNISAPLYTLIQF